MSGPDLVRVISTAMRSPDEVQEASHLLELFWVKLSVVAIIVGFRGLFHDSADSVDERRGTEFGILLDEHKLSVFIEGRSIGVVYLQGEGVGFDTVTHVVDHIRKLGAEVTDVTSCMSNICEKLDS